MKLYITGIGTCVVDDFSEEELDQGASIKTIPAKAYMPAGVRRGTERLAKMFYIAAVKAFEDADYENRSSPPVIAGTGMSEIDAALDLLFQIHESKGSIISPRLVQNTVHNAPSSILSIGLKNTSPVITMAHSFLSGESAVDYAFTLAETSVYRDILVVAGDQYVTRWTAMLAEKKLHHLGSKLESMNFTEGAAALLLSRDKPANRDYGAISACCVFHLPVREKFSIKHLRKFGFSVSTDTVVILREFFRDNLPCNEELAAILDIPLDNIMILNAKEGNSMASPLSDLISYIRTTTFKDILFISSEFNDTALLQYIK